MAPSIMAAVALLVLLAWQLIWGAAAAGFGLAGCNTTCGDGAGAVPLGHRPAALPLPRHRLQPHLRARQPPRQPPAAAPRRRRTAAAGGRDLPPQQHRARRHQQQRRVRQHQQRRRRLAGPGRLVRAQRQRDTPFVLAPGKANELVVTGCGVQATLRGDDDVGLVSSCSSSCSDDGSDVAATTTTSYYPAPAGRSDKYCSGVGCCQAPIPVGRTSFHVRLRRLLFDGDGGARSAVRDKRGHVFVAEAGWFDQESVGPEILRHEHDDTAVAVPVVLAWAIWPSGAEREKRAAATVNATVGRYDINECDAEWMKQACHGYCINTWGSYECVSATGT
ncbi:hypothetical protein HU200_037950 [Digitaria exilis]|uniref:Uncharacterized protein n=1 Tax=Digitaria exilis TaxID=1010633 RepID=A0A835EMB2_9POAL|nr:hypothetical protein HU200_037950 [Digitaria exilis]